LSLPLEPAYKVISCFHAFAFKFNSYRYMQALFSDMDADRDGHITFDEFNKSMANGGALQVEFS
jgi:hypothetical protein